MRFLALTLVTIVSAHAVPAQSAQNMALVAAIPLPPCTTADIWALDARYMLVARMAQGFAVVDTADPKNPIVSTIRPPGYPAGGLGVLDIKSDGRYIYATDESTAQGLFIYDTVPDPMNPTLVSTLAPWLTQVHNCFIDGNYLYAAPTNAIGARLFDVSDKKHVKYLTRVGTGYTHDVTVVGGRAYLSQLKNGFEIVDVTTPRIPMFLGRKGYLGDYTHSAWPSKDGNYLFTTDEIVFQGVGGYIRIWDISRVRPGATPRITQVGAFKAGPEEGVVHNVVVRDDLLFVSYFKEGVLVLDISDPPNPVKIAHYDTFVGTGAGCFSADLAGCWGVHPSGPNSVLISDMETGAYILRLNPIAQTLTTRAPTVQAGRAIELDLVYGNQAPVALGAFGIVLLSSVNSAPTLLPLLVETQTLLPSQSVTRNISIPVPLGVPAMTTIGFTGYTGLEVPLFLSETGNISVQVQ